jgi:uncharacterized protein (TIGR02246 family)
MATNEDQIRTLIDHWAAAVRAGDLAGVLQDHADDIVMYDVPPPQDGVRGIDAYRETWPLFFEWLAQGAEFNIVSLDITAGEDIAFAHALLHCGNPTDPAEPLRLTIGLRKEKGRWTVTHEHHSFPHNHEAPETDVRQVHEGWFEATADRDLDALMSHIAADVVSYEHEAPLEYVGIDSVRKVCEHGLASATGAIDWTVPDLKIVAGGDVAVAWGLNRIQAEQADGTVVESWSRGTRVFQRRNGEWLMTHQHLSFPLDPTTGRAATDLHP